jgi:PDZ domain
MIGDRRIGARNRAAAVAVALAVASCSAPVNVATDEFSTATMVEGPLEATAPLLGHTTQWRIESEVAKAPPHGVAHRVLVFVFSGGDLFDEKESRESASTRFAVDDQAAPLRIHRIGHTTCGFGDANCLRRETVGIAVADATLRAHALSGYRIKIAPRDGDERVLTLTPALIQEQLSAIDRLVQGGIPALPPDAPHLGIGVIDATDAPYAAEPQGVIVVKTVPGSPAAAGGVAPGDILAAIDAHLIRASGDIARIRAGIAPGRSVTLDLRRAGRKLTALVKL